MGELTGHTFLRMRIVYGSGNTPVYGSGNTVLSDR